jgi:hypothetical protein
MLEEDRNGSLAAFDRDDQVTPLPCERERLGPC